MTNQRPYPDDLRAAYTEICARVTAIDDFRSSLLKLLPLASGVGIFLLVSDAVVGKAVDVAAARPFLAPIAVFGFAVTLGLYCYEVRGIQYCAHLIAAGTELEEELEVRGQFRTRPATLVAGRFDEVAAAHVIYGAVLAAWAFVALAFAFTPEGIAKAVPAGVALIIWGAVVAVGFHLKLDPPDTRHSARAAFRDMCDLARSLPLAGAASAEIRRLQERFPPDCKTPQPTASDWRELHDIVKRALPLGAGRT